MNNSLWIAVVTLLAISLGVYAQAPATQQEAAAAAATTQASGPASRPAGGTASNEPAEDPAATWFGMLPKLTDAGFTPHLSYVMDSSRNFRGGINTRGCAIRELLTVGLDVDLGKVANLKGGRFFVNFQDHHGRDGTDLTGETQLYSTIDDHRQFDQLNEIGYEQKLFDDKLRVKIGKIDVNDDFAVVENGAAFLNSSMTYSPAIIGLPTYPNPSFGACAFVYPADWLYAGAGIFDGTSANGEPTGGRGPDSFFTESAKFLIGEAGLKWKLDQNHLPGRLGLGAYGRTGPLETLSGDERHGAAGPYAVLDQTLWRANPADDQDPRKLGSFLQYGWAENGLIAVRQHWGGGLAWTGPLPGRQQDVLGAGVTAVQLSDDPSLDLRHDREITVEAFYKIALTSYLAIKPDLQYIVTPSGIEDDALVATIRLELTW